MKKNYSTPAIEVTLLSAMDIIAASETGKDIEIDGDNLYGKD